MFIKTNCDSSFLDERISNPLPNAKILALAVSNRRFAGLLDCLAATIRHWKKKKSNKICENLCFSSLIPLFRKTSFVV